MNPDEIAYDDRGLVACVIQDAASGEILTLAWMNAEAVARTLSSGELHLYSRSRQQQWHKGETSGNTLAVRALRLDCDGDALLALVDARRTEEGLARPACHTGKRSCFHRGDVDVAAAHEALPALERTLAQRAAERPEGSYTAALLADAPRIAEKVMEEAEEVARAAREESDDRVSEEAADLLYHLAVLLRSREIPLADVEQVLNGRRR
ncbi:MAG: bifunctional phosphoribosyl-AMP cyclohydrolase/phosphoribosyl-ATP diphosphatase HisIE [Solirubrobacterales bacterium]|nr:MAG: bifunctional phosphoribosyl-AMP cyclohydrolase/phosphoribosyl-ATP diphosphatase HisIE [Solirubrobacterales bacterium]